MRHLLFLMAFVFLAVPACRAEEAKMDTLSIVTADGKQHDFTVEVADTMEKRTIGLMFRKEMPADHGMIFIFDEETPRAFWMKNTFIPLDMLFIRKDGTIGHIHENAIPHDETSIPSNGPALVILEINGGRAAALGIRPGDVAHNAVFGNALAKKAAIH